MVNLVGKATLFIFKDAFERAARFFWLLLISCAAANLCFWVWSGPPILSVLYIAAVFPGIAASF